MLKAMVPRLTAVLAVLVAIAAPCVAQDDADPGRWRLGERIRLSGEASASMSTEDAQEEGWFNYSDYETNTMRMVRLSLVGEVTVTRRVAVLAEVRTLQFDTPEAYALYLRVRPWLAHAFDIHLGRVPPTFGAFARRLYVADNPLIGMPLGFQYLTSNRADALPATADELATMRGRGWLTNYTVGNTAAAPGLPLANALRWDTGVQLRWQRDPVTLYGAVTQGTLGNPQLSDDNGGVQVAARGVYTPHPVLSLGASVASGPYLARDVTAAIPATRTLRSYRQEAYGADAELSRDRWVVRGEMIWNRWAQPAFEGAPVRPLDARASMIEARYTLWPGVYAAGRAERLDFSPITTSTGPVTWDAEVTRLELGGGWTVHRHVLLKAVWQRNRRDGGRPPASDIGAMQVVTWF